MSDPWIVAAERIRSEKKASVLTAPVAVEPTHEEEASQTLDSAIAEATLSLADFIDQRGEAAKELLAACDEYILFGVEYDGSFYDSVYFYQGGLGKEFGCNGISALYSKELPSTQVANAHEAVYAFAYHGAGKADPEKVRQIVTWLTEKIDGFAQ